MEEKQIARLEDATKKLFYQDSHMKEFTARVVSCKDGKSGYQVALDQTAFFPEGGGQAGDIGWLNDAVVTDTQEKNGVIYHTTNCPLAVGEEVTGKLDFEIRFDRMQQHTGEHILSGIVHGIYGYDNVGFHLGPDVTTLDFNGELTTEQAERAETLANRAVFHNIPVEVLYPSKEELQGFEYRSKIEIEGQVRIVSIPGIDICACCAPHTHTTGEVGLIKILSCDRHRGGCRLTMASGMRALKDYQAKQKNVTEVSVLLSTKPDAIGEAVFHQKEQTVKLRERLNQFQASYLGQRLREITGSEKNVCIFLEGFDNIAVRNFVNDATERCSGVCAAFVEEDERRYRYILGSKSVDVREMAKRLNVAFGGKGGGKPEMVQGSLTADREKILELIENADK